MNLIRIPTSFNIDVEFEIAPFHLRMLAWFIDVFVQVMYVLVAYKLYVLFLSANPELEKGLNNEDWSIQMILLLPVMFYSLILESLMGGQTVGKKLMNIRVINEQGGRASISQYLIRWMLKVSGFIIIADVISITVTKNAQRLGDLAAGTLLIKTKSHVNLEDTIFIETDDNYIPQFPQVMHLSDRDLNTLQSLLKNARQHNNWEMAARASEKVKSLLKIESPLSPYDFLDTLLKDYNYISTK